jgi:hypothetical protein
MHINCPFLINIQVGNYSHTFTNSFHHNYLNNFKDRAFLGDLIKSHIQRRKAYLEHL